MSGILRVFDPDSTDEETRRLSRLAQKCWSPLTVVYNPLKAGSIDSTDTIPHDKAIIRAQNADFVPSKRIKGRPECTIFVGNLNEKTTSTSLENEFSRYGRVVRAKVVEDLVTGRSRGYGFVEYSIEGEALNAYECRNRLWLDGSKIFVDMECGRLLPGWVPRRLGGGFSGRKESGQLRFGCRERPFKKPIKLLTEREINKFFEKIVGRKAQIENNEDDVDADTIEIKEKPVEERNTKTYRSNEMEVGGTCDVKDCEKFDEGREEKRRHTHKERRRHSEDGKKRRHARSDGEDDGRDRKAKKKKKKKRSRTRSPEDKSRSRVDLTNDHTSLAKQSSDQKVKEEEKI